MHYLAEIKRIKDARYMHNNNNNVLFGFFRNSIPTQALYLSLSDISPECLVIAS